MPRCRKCLLTDAIPGSDFDQNGVCTWCRESYPDYKPLGRDALGEKLRGSLRAGPGPDCVVGISGGKDSSFAVWGLKRFYGLRVHAFTYDHSGVMPFARENAEAVCRSLDVPLSVLSLGPQAHLRSFQDFFSAWLDRPNPVSAGMTCVACKHLHLLGTRLARHLNAPFVIWANCPLENSPFLALRYRGQQGGREGLAKGAALLAREALSSPALVKSIARHASLTIRGCLAFSPSSPFLRWRFPSVEQLMFFEYWPWHPQDIHATLASETAWRKPGGCPNDWHSDCIFNVFKEYMFQRMLGVSYTDGFLSNQIRVGLLSREAAMRDLASSKEYFAGRLGESLERVGLGHLAHRVDPRCFALPERPW